MRCILQFAVIFCSLASGYQFNKFGRKIQINHGAITTKPSPRIYNTQLQMAPAVVRVARTVHLFGGQLVSAATTFTVLFFSRLIDLRSSVVIGGILAGSLHAVTGPDHIAALLPSSIGQRWFTGARIGAAWGLGHGFSATVIGLVAYVLKDKISHQFALVEKLSKFAESAVGLSLLFIGGMGLKETLFDKGSGDDGEQPEKLSAMKSNSAIFTNGVLHGMSWDGFPSLMPTLTLTSWRAVIMFLLAYCVGTMAAMSATAGIVGEGSIRLGEATNNPNLPQKMSIVTSIIAILIGAFWLLQAIH